jgi:hypothetical protein
MSDSGSFPTFFFVFIRRSYMRKFFGLIPAVFVIIFSLVNLNSAGASTTAEIESDCRWTKSDGTSFSHSNCTISYGVLGVSPCSTKWDAHGVFYGVAFPNGPSVEIYVKCSNSIYSSRNNIFIYDFVDGRSAFDCPEKITNKYNVRMCFSDGQKIEFHFPDWCC